MKKWISILLTVLVLLQTCGKLIVFSGFLMNKEYISKNLCINKDKPKSCCEGSCQLKKNFEKESNSEKSTPISQLEQTDFLFNTNTINKSIYSECILLLRKECALTLNMGFQKSVFHPPGQ